MSSAIVVKKTASGRYTAETKGKYKGVEFEFFGVGDTQSQAMSPVLKAADHFKRFVDRVF